MGQAQSSVDQIDNLHAIEYNDRVYRFIYPEIPQNSFHFICKTGTFYEIEMLEDMHKRLKRGDLTIDVGANIGNHTVFMAGICGCDVIALEAFPQTFQILNRNVDINQLGETVTTLNVAAGAMTGYGEARLAAPNNYGQITIQYTCAETEIRVCRLDDLEMPRAPRLIKIDVEGGELEVLRGAKTLISRSYVLIYVETLHEQAFDEVSAFLGSLGYHVIAFFGPAMFLFAKAGDPMFESQDEAPGSALARLCMHHHAEIEVARAKARRFRDSAAYQVGFAVTAPFKLLAALFKRWRAP